MMNKANFFGLFGLPIAFDIDKNALKSALLSLQKQHHPDRVDANKASTNQASLINHAYQVLSHADSRAAYLLELSGQAVDLSQSINDWDFLDEMMDLRIRLDTTDDKTVLEQISSQVHALSQEQSTRFMQNYQNQAWAEAIDATRKLQFLGKLLVDIDAKVTKLLSQSHDDDLYV